MIKKDEIDKDLISKLIEKGDAVEKALLWVVYEQCVYGGKAYAKLLIHGEEAFKALNLRDGCDVSEVENRLFGKGNLPHN